MGAEKENSGASAPNDNAKEHQWLVGRMSIGCFITISSAFDNKAFLSQQKHRLYKQCYYYETPF